MIASVRHENESWVEHLVVRGGMQIPSDVRECEACQNVDHRDHQIWSAVARAFVQWTSRPVQLKSHVEERTLVCIHPLDASVAAVLSLRSRTNVLELSVYVQFFKGASGSHHIS
ncbi:hypothetical protein FVE85_0516 [Porphyridium purpureum]|uniref:Uncharacterized protein n=1 Tax=Porphyridium purpureum TaxID=35688 RepID=A0A5J4Z2A3_PORPP|nr:hypothetical protein FVE85_0516 [Porphyridium purpureum]|eukprot:POR1404..scf208_2